MAQVAETQIEKLKLLQNDLKYYNSNSDYRIALNSSRAIINFEGNFARKYFVNFWEYKYFGESNCSSRSVIEMMRHFDMKRYPRERGKKCIHYFGGAIIRGGATIQGNTVYISIFKCLRHLCHLHHIFNSVPILLARECSLSCYSWGD